MIKFVVSTKILDDEGDGIFKEVHSSIEKAQLFYPPSGKLYSRENAEKELSRFFVLIKDTQVAALASYKENKK